MAASEQPVIYSARPTVRINNQAYAVVDQLILGMEMQEREGGLSALELRLSNIASDERGGADFAFEDDAVLKLGARIAIYTGDETSPQEIFQGVITALEGEFAEDEPPELVVLAEDLCQQARLTRRTQTYTDTTVATLARNLATDLGLTPQITGYTENIGVQVQLNESDLAFVRRLLTRYAGDLQVVGNELHVSPRQDVQRGTVTLELHSELRRVRVIADLAHQVNTVTVTGWDAAQGERINVSSQGADFGPGRGKKGAEILRDALLERKHHIGHLAVATSAEAQAVADAAFAARSRRFLAIEGACEGNAAVRVGAFVTLQGLGPRFSNTYYVTSACHRWDVERGYETEFEAECAFWGGE